MYQDIFDAVGQSQLISQPARLEALVQDFYKNAKRMQLNVSSDNLTILPIPKKSTRPTKLVSLPKRKKKTMGERRH